MIVQSDGDTHGSAAGPALQVVAARLLVVAAAIGTAGSLIRAEASGALGADAWLGSAARAAHRGHLGSASVTDQVAEQLRRAARALDLLGAALMEADRTRSAFESVPGGGLRLEAAERDADATAGAVLRAVAEELRRLRPAGRSVDALVDPAAALMMRSAGLLPMASGGPATAGQVAADLRDLLGRRDPVAVRGYLDSLPGNLRQALTTAYPDLVGSGDGVPATMRYAANRLVLAQALAEARRDGEVALAARIARWLQPGRQFLLVDLAHGRLAEVLGDLDTAAHVAVVVPGMRNDLASFDADLAANARRVQQQADRQAPGQVATIAWLGYRTPGLATAVFDDDALAGAGRLRDLVAGLVLRAAVTTTVVAHSYGSLLTGRALTEGLCVDAVVVLGSPGLGTQTAAGLEAPAGMRLFAARAPGDLVAWSENFGRDPTDPRFGIPRIATGAPSAGGPTGHSSYLSGDSECLRNVGRIVTGDYDDVTVVPPGRLEQMAAPASDLLQAADDGPAAVRAAERAAASALPSGLERRTDDVIEAQERADHLIRRLHDPDFYAQLIGDGRSITK